MSFELDIMGILNVTPDSFSGDGLMQDDNFITASLTQAEQMINDGANWLDIGGESTRPDASEISLDVEMARVIPVIEAIHKKYPDMRLSIDTRRVVVAEKAVSAGAKMINNVSGICADPAMACLAAQTNVKLLIMHNLASSNKIRKNAVIGGEYIAPYYQDVLAEVTSQLAELAESAINEGVSRDNIILDPGLGFGKTLEQNLKLIKNIDVIKALNFPVLLAASRKSFIGHVLESLPEDRLEGMAAIASYAYLKKVNILRVHDVRFISRTIQMINAVATC